MRKSVSPALLARPVGQQLGVPAHRRRDHRQIRTGALGASGEGGGQVGEQPRPAQAAAPDDDAGAAGLAHHPQRVVGLPDVAVAEHRDVEQLDQLGDRRPVGRAAVEVGRRASVQRDVGDAGVLRPQRGVAVGEVVAIDARGAS